VAFGYKFCFKSRRTPKEAQTRCITPDRMSQLHNTTYKTHKHIGGVLVESKITGQEPSLLLIVLSWPRLSPKPLWAGVCVCERDKASVRVLLGGPLWAPSQRISLSLTVVLTSTLRC
jgi:hypothetical protein